MSRRYTLALGGLLAIVAVMGPKDHVADLLDPSDADRLGLPTAPTDLEAWLAGSEAEVGDVLPHATKTIVWANPFEPSRTETVVVYVHGFSATRQEVAPLADTIAARLGANLFYTRLTGHGQPDAAMGEAHPDDWATDMVEAMGVAERLGDRVILIGTSTGGTLATWAATRPDWSGRIEALVLLSPNFAVQAGGAWVFGIPWGGWIANRVAGDERSWQPANELQGRYWTTTYPTAAIGTMMAWLRRVEGLDLEALEVPTWVGYSKEDRVVSPAATERVFEELGATVKELVVLSGGSDPSHHILAGDVMAADMTESVAEQVVAFAQRARAR